MYIVNSKDKCSWNHLKVRAFYYDNMEIIELISDKGEFEKTVLAHHEAPIGESLLDFSAGFYTGDSPVIAAVNQIAERIEGIRNNSDSIEALISYIEEVMLQIPYFCCLYADICNKIELNSTLDLDWLSDYLKDITEEHYKTAASVSVYLMVKESKSSDASEESFRYDTKPMWIDLNLMKFEPIISDGLSTVLPTSMAFEDTLPSFAFDYVLYPTSIGVLINYIIAEHIKRGVGVKKCKNCGREFVSQRNNQVDYCDRVISNTGKTCRQLGAVRVYQSKQNENPIMREYNKSYKTHNARIRYGTITKEEFSEWSVKAREMRQRCIDGEITLEEFIEWLKD